MLGRALERSWRCERRSTGTVGDCRRCCTHTHINTHTWGRCQSLMRRQHASLYYYWYSNEHTLRTFHGRDRAM